MTNNIIGIDYQALRESRVRINDNVRPYSGRIFPAVLWRNASGSEWWEVDVAKMRRGNGIVGREDKDWRQYRIDEVTETE